MKWFGSIILSFLLLSSCRPIKQPEFIGLDGFKLSSMSLDGVGLKFKVVFHNPNSYGVTVKLAETNIYIDSVFAGTFLQDTLVKVPSKADFSIPFSGKVPLPAFLKIDFKNLDKREVLLQAGGKASIGKAGIYVVKDFFIERKQKLTDLKL